MLALPTGGKICDIGTPVAAHALVTLTCRCPLGKLGLPCTRSCRAERSATPPRLPYASTQSLQFGYNTLQDIDCKFRLEPPNVPADLIGLQHFRKTRFGLGGKSPCRSDDFAHPDLLTADVTEHQVAQPASPT